MKEFKAKVGYGILIPVLMLLCGSMLIPIINGGPTVAILAMAAIVLPTIAFTLHTFFTTTYRINDNNQLLIKCGLFFKSVVEISTIKSISETRNPISAPAPSMDRIELKYGKWDSVIISPRNRQGFTQELLKINPTIDNKIN